MGEQHDPLGFLDAHLQSLDERGLRRRLRKVSPAASPFVERGGRQLLHLCSNNYLGLATHPAVVEAARQAASEFGVGAGAARLVTGHFAIHDTLEAEIAALKHTDSALVFPTGYAANLGAITALANRRDVILADALNHASLIDGCRLSGATVRKYRHADTAHLRELLALDTILPSTHIATDDTAAQGDDEAAKPRRRRFIVTDGVFSMDGDCAPLVELAEIAEETGAILVVDDAHGTGVFGRFGAGTADELGLDPSRIHVHIGTLSKALGTQGGFVAGSRRLIEFLLNAARSYVFTTALAPPIAAAAVAAVREIQRDDEPRNTLRRHAERMRVELAAMGYNLASAPVTATAAAAGPISPIVPIVVGDAQRALELSRALETHGVLVSAIRPPTVPMGTSRLRVTVMATHTDADIAMALDAFRVAGREVGLLR